jgi:prepilin-type N-terminal cleavage/methylation domain-containing protein
MTLIEMVVTIVLLGIIATMGVVAVNELRSGYAERQADSNIETVQMAEYRYAVAYGTYTADPAALNINDDAVTVVSVPSLTPGQVHVVVGTEGTLGLAADNADGGCAARRVAPLGLGGEVTVVEFGPGALCDAAAALPGGEAAVAQS